jgi:hypothetical protein
MRRSEHLRNILERKVEGLELATERLDLRHGTEIGEGTRKGRHLGRKKGRMEGKKGRMEGKKGRMEGKKGRM